jgi:hypothetical protein
MDILGLNTIIEPQNDFTDMLGFGQEKNDDRKKLQEITEMKNVNEKILRETKDLKFKNELILQEIKEKEITVKIEIERHNILKNELIDLMNKIDKMNVDIEHKKVYKTEYETKYKIETEKITDYDQINAEDIKNVCEAIVKSTNMACDFKVSNKSITGKFCGRHLGNEDNNEYNTLVKEKLKSKTKVKNKNIPKVEQKEIKKLCKGITQEGNPCKNKEKKNGFCLRHCDISVNINELTVKELKTYAKHIKLTNYSDKKKDELIKMIKYQLKH